MNIKIDLLPFREYLALFKKTVSMHEVFLQRIAAHLNMKLDENFLTFLKYKDDVRQKTISQIFLEQKLVSGFLVKRSRKECERTNRWFLPKSDQIG